MSAFLPVSAFCAGKIIAAGVARDRVTVHYNTVHPDPGPEYGKSKIVLFAGRLDKAKGLPDLLAAWRLVQDLGWQLVIAGDGPLRDDAIAAQSQLPSVRFAGPQSPDEVYRLMGHASVVVACSRIYETFGRTIMEAAAKGTPAIACSIGALEELVVDGETGLLCHPGDSSSLARVLDRVMTDVPLCAQMGRHARARFDAMFSPQIAYRRLAEVYTRLATRAD